MGKLTDDNWKQWAKWYKRIEGCKKDNVYAVDYDHKNACCHTQNKSARTVMMQGDRHFVRCNVFNCPHGGLTDGREDIRSI